MRKIEREMSEEDIKRLATEKAEKAAKQEAYIAHFCIFLPMLLIAFIAALTKSPTGVPLALSTIGMLAGWASYYIVKKRLYKEYYQKYFLELSKSKE